MGERLSRELLRYDLRDRGMNEMAEIFREFQYSEELEHCNSRLRIRCSEQEIGGRDGEK